MFLLPLHQISSTYSDLTVDIKFFIFYFFLFHTNFIIETLDFLFYFSEKHKICNIFQKQGAKRNIWQGPSRISSPDPSCPSDGSSLTSSSPCSLSSEDCKITASTASTVWLLLMNVCLFYTPCNRWGCEIK